MKRMTITGLILALILSCIGLSGCKKIEEIDNNDNTQTEEPQINVYVLEKEYNALLGLAENVYAMLSENENEMTPMQAIEMIEYIQKHRIKPTQELTIALDDSLDDLLELFIKYYMASESEKPVVEAEIIELLEYMNDLSLEIERIIDEHKTII